MKIHCECGGIIYDATDDLRYKAHFISDQDWCNGFDAIDKIIEDVAAGRISTDEGQMAVRIAHRSRLMWQCTKCGRLFIDDQKHNTNVYAPQTEADSKSILAGHRRAA